MNQPKGPMARIERRIEEVERQANSNPFAVIHETLGEERAEEVVDPEGEILWDELTDDELRAIRGDQEPITGTPWSEISDAQLRRMQEGEDPEKVLRRRG